MQFLRVRKVTEMVGFSKTTLYARVKEGSFPKPVRLGPHSVAFLEADVLNWMKSRPKQQNAEGGAPKCFSQDEGADQ
jgi:prophage regulatory protein